MNSENTTHEEYNDANRNIEAEAGVQAAFMLGQLLSNPSLLFEVQIASKELEIAEAVEEDANSGKLCALRYELRYLKLVQIEAQGVHENAHSDVTAEHPQI